MYWIKNAIKKPGALHKELHVPMGKKISKEKLEKASHAKGKEGKRARLALTLEGLHEKEVKGGKKGDEKLHKMAMKRHKAEKSEHKAGVKGDKKLHKMAVKRHKKDKIEKVMHEFKEGMLHSGSKKGPMVKNPKQAMAIALSEAKKVSKKTKK